MVGYEAPRPRRGDYERPHGGVPALARLVSAILLSVAQGSDTYADHQGKLRLRYLELFSDAFHMGQLKCRHPSGLQRSPDEYALPVECW